MSNPFRKIDTIILRVRDLPAAQSWYADFFGSTPGYQDEEVGIELAADYGGDGVGCE